ncbi:MAG: tRNA lysidine(34) synthetase TilS, partial [Clostridia bacterium]|nr:tRNA lysidine(34) synthetase TilS [Clostridia bacterium]
MNIIEKVKKINLINLGDRLILGLSGGSDSMCLLNILLELREEYNLHIIAVHINHMIREDADDDENALREYCDSVNVEFYSKKIDVPAFAKENKLSSEDAGRICRYDFFNDVLKKTDSNKIVTAHNLNDVVETVFMNIIRGTGLNGLTGIEYSQGNIIRPLLD